MVTNDQIAETICQHISKTLNAYTHIVPSTGGWLINILFESRHLLFYTDGKIILYLNKTILLSDPNSIEKIIEMIKQTKVKK